MSVSEYKCKDPPVTASRIATIRIRKDWPRLMANTHLQSSTCTDTSPQRPLSTTRNVRLQLNQRAHHASPMSTHHHQPPAHTLPSLRQYFTSHQAWVARPLYSHPAEYSPNNPVPGGAIGSICAGLVQDPGSNPRLGRQRHIFFLRLFLPSR